MRVFSVGNWAHFGSMIVGIAMFGFGVASVILSIGKRHFQNNAKFWMTFSLLAVGPSIILANSLAQRLPFNPIMLVSNPIQKYYLLAYYLFYFVPFFWGALFLGLVFIAGQNFFGKVYFANMLGSGLGGIALLLAMYWILPSSLYWVPLATWLVAGLAWLLAQKEKNFLPYLIFAASLSWAIGFFFNQINLSPYKGVSYARRFPDSKKVYEAMSPQGLMEIYSSSYFHFAPGLSDAAGFQLKKMPENAYLGMYIDGDGPLGIMKDLPPDETDYLNFLPMSMPYLLKQKPEVMIMQLGGGISTELALKKGSQKITVAEGNPMIREALLNDPYLSKYTGNILKRPEIELIPTEGRIYLGNTQRKFDVIDLSLADSTGLSMPGGSSVTEKYLYTLETFESAMKALKDNGLLAITIWNKEDPPKSTLKTLATAVAAARQGSPAEKLGQQFFIAHTYLSTLSILYKKEGFTASEIQTLKDYCEKMSFEVLYYPGEKAPDDNLKAIFEAYREVYFPKAGQEESSDVSQNLSVSHLYTLFIADLIHGGSDATLESYLFDTHPLTNNHPYLSGFIKIQDIPHFLMHLESVPDEWGYLLLWMNLGVASLLSLALLFLPLLADWKLIFSKQTGKLGVILFFLSLGMGYILVEVGLMSKFLLSLSYPTISISILITGMLVFSGIGSYFSDKWLKGSGKRLGLVCAGIAAYLVLLTLFLDKFFLAIGDQTYGVKAASCLAVLAPLAFLMGFPFATGMSFLARSHREHFFVWAWGINGSFSVVASLLVPILSIILGLSSVLWIAAALYLLAYLAFLGLSKQNAPS